MKSERVQGAGNVADKILFVDDEPAVLDGYKRMLHKEFAVDTAVCGEPGLAAIRDTGPYSVVISDMRMPGINGAEFLAKVRKKSPDSVRMLLTGYTDLNAAIDAINEGNIFRFLTKPCPKETLVEAINIGLAQYHSVTADKTLVNLAQTTQAASPVAAFDCHWDNFESATGLPGPTQARGYMASFIGTHQQCYVVLFKLPLQHTIEQRYGEDAARDYLNDTAQFLTQELRSEDRLFHWGQDVLMAIVKRQVALAAARMEMARMTTTGREIVLNVEGRSVILACPIEFDLLAIAQYATVEDLLAFLDTRPTGMPLGKVDSAANQ
jgi:FixJ family two-component response regulator